MEARRMGTRVLDLRTGSPRRGVALVCLLGLACSSGCATGAGAQVAAVSTDDSNSHERSAAVSNVPAAMLEAALDDAASRLSVDRTGIEVVSAAAVTWPDGSAGCPEPGMLYTQALVPGYRIVLQAGAQVLNYHAGRSGTPRFCPADRVMPPSSGAEQAR
jgi:hypothetical protein